jgi:hypothetical protein
MSRKLQLALIVAIALVIIKAKAQHQHDMSPLSQRGAQVMGFSQEKTTHHFELNQDGGIIEARANDLKDAGTLAEIRGHFGHIAKMFAAGDFNAPMMVHAQDVPGTAAMSRLKDDIHWQLSEIPRGARITIVADNKEAVDAIHDFLRFEMVR